MELVRPLVVRQSKGQLNILIPEINSVVKTATGFWRDYYLILPFLFCSLPSLPWTIIKKTTNQYDKLKYFRQF